MSPRAGLPCPRCQGSMFYEPQLDGGPAELTCQACGHSHISDLERHKAEAYQVRVVRIGARYAQGRRAVDKNIA